MNCHEAQPRLSAYIDGELAAEDSQAVSVHVRECSSCARQLEDLRAVDQQLSALRVPADLPARIQVSVSNAKSELPRAELPRAELPREGAPVSHSRLWVWAGVAALAACLVLAFRATDHHETPTPPTVALAGKIVRATGQIEMMAPDARKWNSVTVSELVPVPEGTRVRTAVDACEIETSQRGLIRVNQDAELIVHEADRVEIVRGQIWCRAPADASISVQTPGEAWGTTQVPMIMLCPSDSEFQLSIEKQQASCSSLAAKTTAWQMGEWTCKVAPGETVVVDHYQNVQRRWDGDGASKVWHLPLLAVDRPDVGQFQGELSSILQPLLVPIGRSKASHMHEQQIRALGPAGAIPLLAYALSAESHREPKLRYTAVRMAAEMSDHSA
ncbi:MAG: anti-sigma factor, partial [Pirellulales bacterium]|nr:anti-sigma factor [Pirellulales bacterium]